MLRKHGVRRYASGELEIELSYSAFKPPAVPEPAPDDAAPAKPDSDRCPCGHSIEVEHNDYGCLHGCGAARCVRHPDEVA